MLVISCDAEKTFEGTGHKFITDCVVRDANPIKPKDADSDERLVHPIEVSRGKNS